MIRLDDLPPGRLRDAARRAIAAGETTPAGQDPPSARRVHPSRGRRRWVCAGVRGCGAVLTSWAASERHADAHGGGRLDLDLEALR